jgi:hypothetical protein
MLDVPDAGAGLGIGTTLQVDPFHSWEVEGKPASAGVGPPWRLVAQVDDHTAKQCDGDVQAKAGVDRERSRANECGLATMDHDEPFQASTMIPTGADDRPVIGRSTVPTARQKEMDVHDTACRTTDPVTAGIGSVRHCVPSQLSTRARTCEPTC